MEAKSRAKLFKLLRLAGSDQDGEALSALRKLKLLLQADGMSWNQFVGECEEPETIVKTKKGGLRDWADDYFGSDHQSDSFRYYGGFASGFANTERMRRAQEEMRQRQSDEEASKRRQYEDIADKNREKSKSRWFGGVKFD